MGRNMYRRVYAHEESMKRYWEFWRHTRAVIEHQYMERRMCEAFGGMPMTDIRDLVREAYDDRN